MFSNYSGWAASKFFFCKMSGFHRFHGWGNVQLVFKQNRPLWECAFLGFFVHLQWVSLLFAISPLQFLFFLQRQKRETKTQKKHETKKKDKTQHSASDPLPLRCAILFFFLFFLVSWCFAFLVRCYFEGLAKKVAGSNSLPLFPP